MAGFAQTEGRREEQVVAVKVEAEGEAMEVEAGEVFVWPEAGGADVEAEEAEAEAAEGHVMGGVAGVEGEAEGEVEGEVAVSEAKTVDGEAHATGELVSGLCQTDEADDVATDAAKLTEVAGQAVESWCVSHGAGGRSSKAKEADMNQTMHANANADGDVATCMADRSGIVVEIETGSDLLPRV